MRFKIIHLPHWLILSIFTLMLFNTQIFAQSENSELKKLTSTSDVIVVGKVVKRTSQWNENKTRIFTSVLVDAGEYLKGRTDQKQIVITKPGGEVGDVGEQYSHIPDFEDNEEVLLFLKKDKNDNLVVNNGSDGKYSIKSSNDTGTKMISESKSLENYKIKIKSFVQE